jgi:pimeloyl-ACP methyl ester carboxylesterase
MQEHTAALEPDAPASSGNLSLARCLAAAAAAPPALALALAGLLAPALGRAELSVWGWLWSFEAVALAVGLGTIPSRRRRFARVRAAGVAGLVLLGLVRTTLFGGSETAHLVVIDRAGHVASGARLLDRLFEERDAAMVGSRLLVLAGAVRASEFRNLPSLLAQSYPQLEQDAPRLGTPIPATLLGLQRADAFDAIVVAPEGAPSGLGVVFLHGLAGNFALPCLEVARAARRSGAETICPSTRFEGDWWRGDGEAIIRASIAHLRSRGARAIVLVGLSHGGLGASRLAGRLGREIDGLVLVSGVAANAPTPRVPTLVVQGERDAMARTGAVRAWARGRVRVRYVELPGTHFVLLEERARVAEALRRAFALPRSSGSRPRPRGERAVATRRRA